MRDHSTPKLGRPKNPHATIWRYMDFLKYVDLLRSSQLYCCRLDRLSDPYEGKSPSSIAALTEEANRPHGMPKFRQLFVELMKTSRNRAYVNCWHLSESESMAMWRLYAGEGYGIAIKSTFAKLRTSFDASSIAERVFIAKVSYGRDEPTGGWIHWAARKRKPYAFERELRLIVASDESEFDPTITPGYRLKVDLSRLVTAVVVSPEAGTLLRECVEAATSQFGATFPIATSDLAKPPPY